MALIDFDDTLTELGDIHTAHTHRHKIYNILAYTFEESPQLWIDLTLMIQENIFPHVRTQAVIDHLRDFACEVHNFNIQYHIPNGILTITITQE